MAVYKERDSSFPRKITFIITFNHLFLMKELVARGLTTKLSDLRGKNPKVQTAALFVEKLFGRPLKNDPDTLVISDENRQKVLDCVAEVPVGVCYSPFSFLLTEEQKLKSTSPGVVLTIGFEDIIARPRETWKRHQELAIIAGKRASVEETCGKNQRSKFSKLRQHQITDFHNWSDNLLCLQDSTDIAGIVHELVHSEDTVEAGTHESRLSYAVAEGRATFAEEVCIASMKENPDLEEDLVWLRLRHLPTRLKRALLYLPKFYREFGILKSVKDLADFIKPAFKTSYAQQRYYYPFAIALADLSDALRNPNAAFRIATAKPPKTFREIRHALEYYAEEIERYKQELRSKPE